STCQDCQGPGPLDTTRPTTAQGPAVASDPGTARAGATARAAVARATRTTSPARTGPDADRVADIFFPLLGENLALTRPAVRPASCGIRRRAIALVSGRFGSLLRVRVVQVGRVSVQFRKVERAALEEAGQEALDEDRDGDLGRGVVHPP